MFHDMVKIIKLTLWPILGGLFPSLHFKWLSLCHCPGTWLLSLEPDLECAETLGFWDSLTSQWLPFYLVLSRNNDHCNNSFPAKEPCHLSRPNVTALENNTDMAFSCFPPLFFVCTSSRKVSAAKFNTKWVWFSTAPFFTDFKTLKGHCRWWELECHKNQIIRAGDMAE